MIQGNQTWNAALVANQKQPLYILAIPHFGVYLASFSTGANVTVGGLGVAAYGVAPYGT